MTAETDADDVHDDIIYPSAIPFMLVHLGCFAAIWTGVTWQALALCIALYWLRIFAIGAGYHRYFSHRAYSTSRAFQFVLAFLSQTTAQKSVIWWASKHRHHHLHSDTEARRAFAAAQRFHLQPSRVDFLPEARQPDFAKVSDLTRYPELMWLHKFELLPAVAPRRPVLSRCAGWSGLVVGFLWSTVLVYHATFCINSLAHVSGSKRYVTGDNSRNNWLLAIVHHGRRLAQQSPRLSEQRPAGLQMVGNRSDLLPLAGAVLDRPGLGPQDAARAGACATSSGSAPRSSIVPPSS